ncbi:MAG: hypothetical protein QXR44_03170 [Thermoproteota archaeon]
MVSKAEVAGKGTLFAVAIGLITTGSQIIQSDFNSGLVCLIVGIALIVVWAFLIDYEARREAVQAAEKAVKSLMGKADVRERYS